MAPLESSSILRWTGSLVVVMLLAGCGGGGDSGGGSGGSPPLSPSADVDVNETVSVGTAVALDGSASQSPAGAPVSYQWTLTEKPAGSTASLSHPTSVRPTFMPDVAGSYTVTLVTHANGVASQPAAVKITCVTGNVAPRAEAGPDRGAVPDRAITLDGTASRDPNNTPVTYSWRIAQQPPESNPTFTNRTTATPTFTADRPGLYTVALTVSDGSLTSPVDQMTITVATGNQPPMANAGPDQTVTAGQRVTLNGTGSSDPNGDPLTYSWCLKGRPVGSTATLSSANTPQPTFTPDIAGSYVFCLTVNDGKAGSASDSVVVEAQLPSSVGGVLQAYVKASNPRGGSRGRGSRPGDEFGLDIAMSDNTLVVGAPNEYGCATGINGDHTNETDSGCPFAGAVYVFTRANGSWSQQAYIKSPTITEHGNHVYFGSRVALSGDTLAVSAWGENSCARGINGNQANHGCDGAGAVYVFTRANGVWSQQAYLKAINTDNEFNRWFGSNLALDGETLAVVSGLDRSCAMGINGDPYGICGYPTGDTGAAYVFVRSNEVWAQQAYIKRAIHDPSGVSVFGQSVAVNGDTLAVAALPDVNVYSRSNGTWTQEAVIHQGTIDETYYGFNMALSGDTLALTAAVAAIPTAVDVFVRSAGTWSRQAHLLEHEPNDGFGMSLAVEGDTLVVGATSENSCARGINGNQADNNCPLAGAAYVFNRNAGVWSQQAYVKASNTDPYDKFGGKIDHYGGRTIALSNGTLAIGASGESSCASGINANQMDNGCLDAGAVYIYEGR